MARRFEALHLPFSPSCRLMRVFRPVVQTFVLPVLDPRYQLPFGRTVTGQLVRDQNTRWPHLPLQKLTEQALRGPLVSSALNQDIKHDAVLIDGAPQPMFRTGNGNHDLIQVPFIARVWQLAADLVGEVLAELARPLAHGFMAHDDAALALRLTHIPTEVADGVSFRAHEGGDGRRHAKCQAE